MKEFAPLGSKFFPFRVDPFSEGKQNRNTAKLKPYFICINIAMIIMMIHIYYKWDLEISLKTLVDLFVSYEATQKEFDRFAYPLKVSLFSLTLALLNIQPLQTV